MLAAAAAVATAAGPAGSPDDTYFSVSPPPAVPGDPNIGTMQDYLAGEDENVAPLGIAVRADERTLSSGEKQSGLLVISVDSGGPAAKAGLKSTHRKIKTVVEAASIAGALFFPPAMMVVPLLEATKAGESYDLIVGVDGNRVTDVLDFEDCLRDLQPGEIVYLSIVRNGQRVQLPVPMPPAPES
ncbi:MAG TPA: PDZ domain-containing protein [Candidatus Binataceae bacterium]|nr:PDZ domain-containing protein [Candidatus Binataceae bacterium]